MQLIFNFTTNATEWLLNLDDTFVSMNFHRSLWEINFVKLILVLVCSFKLLGHFLIKLSIMSILITKMLKCKLSFFT